MARQQVNGSDIANDSVNSDKIVDGSILYDDLSLGAKAKIAITDGWASPIDRLISDGVDDKFEVPHNSNYDVGTGDFSIETKVKFIEHKDSYFIIHLDGTSGYILQTLSSGGIYPRLKPVGGSLLDYSLTPVTTTLNKWHHVVMTFDRDGNYVGYLDGKQVVALPISASAGDLDTAADLTVNSSGSAYNKNELSTIRIYNKALSLSEVTELYNNGDFNTQAIPSSLIESCILNLCKFGKLGVFDCAKSSHGNTSGSPISVAEKSRPLFYRDVKVSITGNTTLTDVVPAGYKVVDVAVRNSTANAVTISLGSSAGGTQLVNALVVGANATVYAISAVTTPFSSSAAQSLYIHSSDWNSSSVSIIVSMIKVTEGY